MRQRSGLHLAISQCGWALSLVILLASVVTSECAVAGIASQALANCRATVGRPIVWACVQERLITEGGRPRQHVVGCRERARPAVKGCFQNAMMGVIADCRESVGKPIVQACVRLRIQSEGRFLIEQVESCRKSAYSAVRACVWRTSAADE
jgi:hypothetical protein